MNKELSLRTLAYLVGHYKNHNETIINSEEIEAINFILDENEQLQQENKQLKSKIENALDYIEDNTYYKNHIGKISGDDLYIILKGEENGE